MTTKDTMQAREISRMNNSGRYSYVNNKKNLTDKVNIPESFNNTASSSGPTSPPRGRMSRPTPCLTREDLQLPPAPTCEYNGQVKKVGFELTSSEINFIERYASMKNMRYEDAVAKLIHDGLDLLQRAQVLVNHYNQ